MKLIELLKKYENLELDDSKVKELKDFLGIKDNKFFKPEYHEKYYYIGYSGEVNSSNWCNDITDNRAFSIGNVFKTPEEAEFERERLKVIAELKRYAQTHNKCKSNFLEEEDRFCIAFNYEDVEIRILKSKELKRNDIFFLVMKSLIMP